MKKKAFKAAIILFAAIVLFTGCAGVKRGMSEEKEVSKVEFIGGASIKSGTIFKNTVVGGFSGIVYDEKAKTYYAISDDRSSYNAARYYTLDINLADMNFTDSDITLKDVVTLLDENGKAYEEEALDPESICLTKEGNLYISSEGNTEMLINPFINKYSIDGKYISSLPVDKKFLPTKDLSSGVRNNRAFENITITPDGKTLFAANEDTLFQDGENAYIGRTGTVRFIEYNLKAGKAVKEFLYEISAIEDKPGLDAADPTNSVADIIALDNDTFLVLERYYDDNGYNTDKLYLAETEGLEDVTGEFSIKGKNFAKAEKTLLYDFATIPSAKDDFEGLALGPILSDGRQSLIVVSDNDFEDIMDTQVFLFAIE